jgi:signal transduction histidine kinase
MAAEESAAHAAERGDRERRLEELVAELETANSRLRERLEDVQQHRSEFISMVIHEMNQPLTNITGYAQLLQRSKPVSDRAERALQVIVGETNRLGRLLRDLADASRLAAGDFSICPIACDVLEIIGIQVELARATTERHTILMDLPSETLTAILDQDRIAQVVSNLLRNAIVHTPGGRIHVACWNQGDQAFIAVTDSGSGIPDDRMDVIFEPHVRLPGRQKPLGSGLGLYIARGIVETHGGRIWAENQPDGGARFNMVLPLRPGGSA